MKTRLDQALVQKGLVASRSQAESYIKLGYVTVDGNSVNKPGALVSDSAKLQVTKKEQYVSRAALKLESVAQKLDLSFRDKVVLDVGSSTGGFTDYALRNGAQKVIAVDVGTNQLHPSLRTNPKVELHEQTDIRNYVKGPTSHIGIVVIDVSFISLRDILPHVADIAHKDTDIIAMVKPQFEALASEVKHRGVIKNDSMRRSILKDFEAWSKKLFIIFDKADSEVTGEKGNKERFYKLKKLS
jgi:23S rRNA (cytidine1920-2'-O)/16S rRNA (cytidine1409-2'-O)-methyltransferase